MISFTAEDAKYFFEITIAFSQRFYFLVKKEGTSRDSFLVRYFPIFTDNIYSVQMSSHES